MQINVIYDQSVSSLPAGLVAAVNYVVSYFDTLFTNPVTVNIDLGYGEIGGQALDAGALGESETYAYSASYSTVLNALYANEPGASQKAAYATLSAASPLSGGTLWLSTAQEKALGLLPASYSAIDGYVGLSNTYPFSYSPTATPAFNQFYLVGVIEHEFSEVMGRTSFLGEGIGGTTSYSVMDLFRYAAAGVRQLSTGGPAYFSINGGSTNLDSWNTNPNGDLGDWAGSAGADAFSAFSPSGQVNGVTATDLTLMNVLGWDTTTPNNDAAEIARLYYALLNRAPDPGGLQAFTNALENGASLSQCTQSILGSAEYQTTSIGESNASFVQFLYSTALGRAADASGFQGWENALNTGAQSRADAVNGFLSSSEFQSGWGNQTNATYIDEVYRVALGRDADFGGLAGWEAALSNDMSRTTFDQLVVGSQEFQNNITTPADQLFVTALYEQALGRAPDAAGLASWTNALVNGYLNNVGVVIGIAESPEAQRFLSPLIDPVGV
jgi:hypothetical protein